MWFQPPLAHCRTLDSSWQPASVLSRRPGDLGASWHFLLALLPGPPRQHPQKGTRPLLTFSALAKATAGLGLGQDSKFSSILSFSSCPHPIVTKFRQVYFLQHPSSPGPLPYPFCFCSWPSPSPVSPGPLQLLLLWSRPVPGCPHLPSQSSFRATGRLSSHHFLP